MGNLDQNSRRLLENYLISINLKADNEHSTIERINDPARLLGRLERASEESCWFWLLMNKFMAMVILMDTFPELIYLWKKSRGKSFNFSQEKPRDFIEGRMNVVLSKKEAEDIEEMLQYLGRTPICTNPQRILIVHLKRVFKGNVSLIKKVIKGKLKLPYNLKDFFTQEVRNLISE